MQSFPAMGRTSQNPPNPFPRPRCRFALPLLEARFRADRPLRPQGRIPLVRLVARPLGEPVPSHRPGGRPPGGGKKARRGPGVAGGMRRRPIDVQRLQGALDEEVEMGEDTQAAEGGGRSTRCRSRRSSRRSVPKSRRRSAYRHHHLPHPPANSSMCRTAPPRACSGASTPVPLPQGTQRRQRAGRSGRRSRPCSSSSSTVWRRRCAPTRAQQGGQADVRRHGGAARRLRPRRRGVGDQGRVAGGAAEGAADAIVRELRPPDPADEEIQFVAFRPREEEGARKCARTAEDVCDDGEAATSSPRQICELIKGERLKLAFHQAGEYTEAAHRTITHRLARARGGAATFDDFDDEPRAVAQEAGRPPPLRPLAQTAVGDAAEVRPRVGRPPHPRARGRDRDRDRARAPGAGRGCSTRSSTSGASASERARMRAERRRRSRRRLRGGRTADGLTVDTAKRDDHERLLPAPPRSGRQARRRRRRRAAAASPPPRAGLRGAARRGRRHAPPRAPPRRRGAAAAPSAPARRRRTCRPLGIICEWGGRRGDRRRPRASAAAAMISDRPVRRVGVLGFTALCRAASRGARRTGCSRCAPAARARPPRGPPQRRRGVAPERAAAHRPRRGPLRLRLDPQIRQRRPAGAAAARAPPRRPPPPRRRRRRQAAASATAPAAEARRRPPPRRCRPPRRPTAPRLPPTRAAGKADEPPQTQYAT